MCHPGVIEHLLQNSMTLILNHRNIKGAIPSPRSHIPLGVQCGDVLWCRTGSWMEGRENHWTSGCPSPQQKLLGCLGTAEILQQTQFICSAAIAQQFWRCQVQPPWPKDLSHTCGTEPSNLWLTKRGRSQHPGGMWLISFLISHEASPCREFASDVSKVQREDQQNECSVLSHNWSLSFCLPGLFCVFPFSHSQTKHRVFHRVHLPSGKHIHFPRPAL